MKSDLIFIGAFALFFGFGVFQIKKPADVPNKIHHPEEMATFAKVRQATQEQAKKENNQPKAVKTIKMPPKAPQKIPTIRNSNEMVCHSPNKYLVRSKYNILGNYFALDKSGESVIVTSSNDNNKNKIKLPITGMRELNQVELKGLFKPYSNCTASINIDNFLRDECSADVIIQYKSNGIFSYEFCGRAQSKISGKYHIENNILYTKEDITNEYKKFKILIDNNQIYYIKFLENKASSPPQPILILD